MELADHFDGEMGVHTAELFLDARADEVIAFEACRDQSDEGEREVFGNLVEAEVFRLAGMKDAVLAHPDRGGLIPPLDKAFFPKLNDVFAGDTSLLDIGDRFLGE